MTVHAVYYPTWDCIHQDARPQRGICPKCREVVDLIYHSNGNDLVLSAHYGRDKEPFCEGSYGPPYEPPPSQ